MDKDLIKAKETLETGGYTCVLSRGEELICTKQRGVKPLVMLKESGRSYCGYCAADKVVGKATAFLYVLLGVKAVYAAVISRAALDVLKDNSITLEYGTLVDNIINRKGDGICPFEAAVLDISDASSAYTAIKYKMREMNIQ